MKRLPENTENIAYYRNNKKQTVTSLTYDCGCSVDIIWEDISTGTIESCEMGDLCEEHDATIPFCK